MITAEAWAVRQWQDVDLGDERLKRRALAMGQRMAQQPAASLPQQMGDAAALEGAYRLLNNPRVGLEALLGPHVQETLAQAGKKQVVLWVQDTTVLDYTHHWRSKKGLGQIGDGRGYGLLLHSTLGVEPTRRQVLGLGDMQAFLRAPKEGGKKNKGWRGTPEGEAWQKAAQAVGPAQGGALWVHVADREGDNFAYMAVCVGQHKHFLVRIHRNRRCRVEGGDQRGEYLMSYARRLTADPEHTLAVTIPRRRGRPACRARLQVAWGKVIVEPPAQAPKAIREHGPLAAWVIRVWEPDPPSDRPAIEWVLLTSLPVTCLAEAQEKIAWYSCRWLCEDYHQCLKTGCRIEQTQLDTFQDIQRLLGFLGPIAVRLLQLRQAVRQEPEGLARDRVDPWMVKTLARLIGQEEARMSVREFWFHVARLGGFLWRKGDGQPGWRTLWRGWKYLADLTRGARLFSEEQKTPLLPTL